MKERMKRRSRKFLGIFCLVFAFCLFANLNSVHAAAKKSVETKITEELFKKNVKKSIDISSYNLKPADAKKAVNKVLKKNHCTSLVTYSLKTGKDQRVDKVNVTMDSAFEAAVGEINQIGAKNVKDGTDAANQQEKLQKAIADYAKLQEYYEANPDYFGVPVPFFYKKDTTESPLGAIAALAGVDYNTLTQDLDAVDKQINDMEQGLEKFVQYYGTSFLKEADKILAKVNDNSMSEVEKQMVLNDYLANLITFDDAFFQGKQEFVSSTAFGALVEKKAVCIGYCSAYAYIVQRMHPEIYKNADGTWKTKKEVGDNAIVDYACRTHNHYINAVKIDGKWYYVDPSFADIKVEENQRVRAETEGNLGHMFFLFTQKDFEKWSGFSGSDLDTAYADKCTDSTYENAWFSQVDSPISYNDSYWYYVKPQANTKNLYEGGTYHDKRDQLTCRNRKTGKIQTLVDYETGKVYTPDGREVATNQDIVNEYKKDVLYNKIYPGLQHSVGLYGGNLYFNLGNKIYEYQTANGKITLIKEYNEVAVKQTNDANVSQSFYVAAANEGSIMKVKERPVAGISIKDDGKMYVALATNLSSKTDYKTECVNYKPAYGNFGEDNGLSKNFEKCANIKETLDMSHLVGSSHNYQKVTVAPTCLRGGFEEERCTICGRVKEGSRKETSDPVSHQYEYNATEETRICKICKKADPEGITYKEPTYEWAKDGSSCTAVFKDENGQNEKRIPCNVTSNVTQNVSCEQDEQTTYTATCTFEDKEFKNTKVVPTKKATGHQYGDPEFQWSEDKKTCKAVFICSACKDKKEVDCKVNKEEEKATCEKDGKTTYTATVTLNGKDYTNTKTEKEEATGHQYGDPEFQWSKDKKTCKAVFICSACKDKKEVDCKVNKEEEKATCEKDGKITYTATATLNGKDYTNTKTEKEEATGHQYGDPEFQWSEDKKTCKAIFTCSVCKYEKKVDCKMTVKEEEKATCEKDGKATYTASITLNGKNYTDAKSVVVKATGHQYGDPAFTWSKDKKTCKAVFICSACKDKKEVDCKVNKEEEKATCEKDGKITYTATATLNGKDYTNTKTEKEEATGHQYGDPEFQWSKDKKTCKAVFTCSVCKHEEKVDCKMTVKEEVKATCEKDGKTTYTASITFNGKNYTDAKSIVVKAAGHQYGDPVFTWDKEYKNCTAKIICKACGKTITETCKVSKVETKNPTDAENGYYLYRAEVVLNGKTYTNDQKEIIPATGHKYNKAPVFKWSEDKKTCVAEFKCTNCSNVQQVPCTVSFEETKKATCEKDGEAVYTASCKFDGKGYVNVKTVTVKATGHEYGEAAFTWSKDYKTCTAKATCKTCGKTVTKTCKVSKVDSKEATDTEDGYCQYRAEVVLNGKTYTDDKKEVIPAKGHQYGNPKFVWSKDYQSCVLKLTCADCKDVKEIECTVTSKGTKATCTKNGKVVYTAVGAFYGKEYKDSKTVAVKATGHDFDKNGVCKNCKIQMLKSVSSAGKNMTVSWKKVSKANGYYVYRSTNGKKFTKVKTITSGNTVKFNDTKANKNGQKYVYKIVAYTKDNNGKKTVIVTTKKTKTGYFLSTPKVTSVKNQKGAKAVVAWTTNKKASGYQIEYTVSGGKSQTMTVSAKNKNATLKNLKKKKIYTIRVRSYKTVSNTKYYSAWSSKKTVKVNK